MILSVDNLQPNDSHVSDVSPVSEVQSLVYMLSMNLKIMDPPATDL